VDNTFTAPTYLPTAIASKREFSFNFLINENFPTFVKILIQIITQNSTRVEMSFSISLSLTLEGGAVAAAAKKEIK
jgi:hypothetical protein